MKYYVNREMTLSTFQAFEIDVPDAVVASGSDAIREFCKENGPDWRDGLEVERDRMTIEAED